MAQRTLKGIFGAKDVLRLILLHLKTNYQGSQEKKEDCQSDKLTKAIMRERTIVSNIEKKATVPFSFSFFGLVFGYNFVEWYSFHLK